MATTIGLILLGSPFALILILGSFVLVGDVFLAFAKSRIAWIASALVLPHIASKLMDRIYDALIAGNLADAFFYGLPLACVLISIDLLLRASVRD
jgi:hypothetical protein